jgi:cytidine deaminase
MDTIPRLRGIFYSIIFFMEEKQYQFRYEVYETIEELKEEDKWLLEQAREATRLSYAPYSKFFVGAVALLDNGEVVAGANQENASFPAGLCAERVVLAAISSSYPKAAILTMAISYRNEKGGDHSPITPCGVCRQALQENVYKTGKSIKLILGGMDGKVMVISDTSLLLPFSFTGKELKG